MRASALYSLGLSGFAAIAAVIFGLGRPVGRGLAFVLGLESGSLGLARAGLLELGVAAQVLEGLADVEVDAHLTDVGGAELVARLGSGGADGGREGADVAELDLIALEDELAHAHGEFGEDAYDGALGEHGVVVGDMLGQFVDVYDAGKLEVGIGLLGLVGFLGVGLHSHAVLNFLH